MRTETSQTTKPKAEYLLEEYRLSHDYANHMDSIAWQMAAVLLPVSLASLAYLFSLSGQSGFVRLAIVTVVSGISITILWAWLQLFKRWLAYQQVAYYRMAEIEDELGLWLVRYGQILRSDAKPEGQSDLRGKPEDSERYQHLRERFGKFPQRKTELLITLVVRILIAGWILLAIMEFARTIFNL